MHTPPLQDETPAAIEKAMSYGERLGGLGIEDSNGSGLSLVERAKLYNNGILRAQDIARLASEITSMWDGGAYSFQGREALKSELATVQFDLNKLCEGGNYKDSEPMQQLRAQVDAQLHRLNPQSAITR